MPKYKFSQLAINSTEKKKPTEADKDTYIGLEHLDSGTLTVSRWGAEVAPIGEKLIMRKGDVLFGKRRAYQKKVGIAPFDGIFSAHGMVLRPREEVITKEYFPLFISSDYFLNEAIRISVGSLSPTVNWKDLRDLEFFIPTIEEQRRLTPLVWAAIETRNAYKSLIERTDELVKSQFIEMFGDPVTNTQNRNVVPFGSYMTSIKYGTSQPPVFTENGKYKFIRATNIKSGRITEVDMLRIDDAAAAKLEKCKLHGHEIIIVRSGANTGDTCVVTAEYANQYAGYDIIISLDQSRCNSVFYNELLNSHYMQQVVKPLTARSAQPHINAQQVQNLPMLEASLEEQNAFAALVEQRDKSKFVVSNRNLSRCLEVRLRSIKIGRS